MYRCPIINGYLKADSSSWVNALFGHTSLTFTWRNPPIIPDDILIILLQALIVVT